MGGRGGYSGVGVSTGRYEGLTGKTPRGRGNWAFKIGSETKFFSGSYSNAKKQAQKDAYSNGVYSIKLEY